jgi:glycosyltransferase involved in cell wall biosynthesis
VTRRRMLVLCPHPQGVAAGQRLKYEQYLDDWRAAGWDITVSSYMDDAMWRVVYEKGHARAKAAGIARGHLRRMRDLARVARYDLVYVFMWATPVGTSVFERIVRRLARHVIYDVEDNVLVGQRLNKGDNPNPLAKLIKGPGKARYLIRTADHVIASSPFLADTCRGMNASGAATYISSSVDTDRFQPTGRYSNDHPVVIGWTGTFSTKPFLDLLADVFRRLSQRVPFTLKVIGNFDYDLPGVPLEVVRWTAANEVADLQTFDIGVYPLPIDDWVTGKSGLKAIQYMAFALPCVATEVGTTPLLIRDDENGLLVRSDDEWVDALERLVRDADLRRRLGTAARADAVARYSLHAVAGQYRAVIDSVMAA